MPSAPRILLVLISLLYFFSVSPARAAVPIQRLSFNATLSNDGSVKVVQQIQYSTATSLHWKIYSNTKDLKLMGDNKNLSVQSYRLGKSDGDTFIKSSTVAKDWTISYTTTTNLVRHNDRDQIYLKIFQEPGQPIFNISANFSLPEDAPPGEINGNAYSISGVVNPSFKSLGRTMQYRADYAAPTSLFTISANWSKDVLNLETLEETRLTLSNLEVIPWVFLGVILPAISLTVLSLLLLRQRRAHFRVTEIKDYPPSQLSAMLVGVLVRKKIYPQEIVALLVELCQKGYLVIVQRTGKYYLSQRKTIDEYLEPWEKKIIEEIFPVQGTVETEGLQAINDQSLFSPRVRDAFRQIYQVITEKRFFLENPHYSRIKYKLIALLIYFVSAAALVWVAVVGASPYLSIPLGGTVIVAFLIIRLSPKLVRYSQQGIVTRKEWMAFANYLSLREPLPLEATQHRLFEKYLPYAIALNKTREWAERFDRSNTTILRPDWFIAYRDTTTTEFVDEILDLTEKISQTVTSLRGPLVT